MSQMIEEENEIVSGPICEFCGKSSNSIYECYEKRERRGRFEMVKIFLCAIHFMAKMEIDALPPPPEDEEESDEENWKKFMGPEEDDDDDEEGIVDHINQSWG